MNYKLNTETEEILKNKNITFTKASITELDDILELYKERMKWFKDNNINQWSDYFKLNPKEKFIDAIENNNYFMLKENNKIIAGFELTNDSKYWKDDITPTYYLYKVVIKTGYKNIGDLIFRICKDIAESNNKECLRLNCRKDNEKLNNIYENHGFKFIKNIYDYYDYTLRKLKIN